MTTVPSKLESLDYKQLKTLSGQVTAAIAAKTEEAIAKLAQAEARETDRVRDMLRMMADSLGVKPEPIPANGAHKGKPRKISKVAVKFRHGSDTWTGRGRPPRWLSALEAKGAKREAYRVSA